MNTLEDKLKATVLAAALVEEKHRKSRPILRWVPFAAAAVAAASLALFIITPAAPKDSFDDPAQAYAELERTFAYISEKIDNSINNVFE